MEKELCWCGSGHAYEDCHKIIDDKIAILAAQGKEVPTRDMIKTPEQLEGIRKACALNTAALDEVEKHIKAGITTGELDRIIYEFIIAHGGVPGDLGYYGFPKSVTISVNDVVFHGIPGDKPYDVLKNGDIVNVDVTSILHDYYADANMTFLVGQCSDEAKKIVDVARNSLKRALTMVKPGNKIGDIGWAIQDYAEGRGCSVVRDYIGHGIGRGFHEAPEVPHFGRRNTGIELVPGMVFTIEPMINLGEPYSRVLDDDWTAVTTDGSLSAQFEQTLVVTENGYEVLTPYDL